MASPSNAFDEQAVRDELNAWVARFAPLVMAHEVLTEGEVRERIHVVGQLRRDAVTLDEWMASNPVWQTDTLAATFAQARRQLDSVEGDLRRHLAILAPGDPEGRVDLDALQDRLAERAARDEAGVQNEIIPEILNMQTARGSVAGGAFMGLFGLGFGGFATFHALLMIGGMWQAFGPVALAMLLFYSIFWGASAAILIGAFKVAANEVITVDGSNLVVTRRLGPVSTSKRYTLPANAEARIETVEITTTSGNRQSTKSGPAIVLTDVEGNPIHLATQGITKYTREQNLEKLNAYLKAQRA